MQLKKFLLRHVRNIQAHITRVEPAHRSSLMSLRSQFYPCDHCSESTALYDLISTRSCLHSICSRCCANIIDPAIVHALSTYHLDVQCPVEGCHYTINPSVLTEHSPASCAMMRMLDFKINASSDIIPVSAIPIESEIPQILTALSTHAPSTLCSICHASRPHLPTPSHPPVCLDCVVTATRDLVPRDLWAGGNGLVMESVLPVPLWVALLCSAETVALYRLHNVWANYDAIPAHHATHHSQLARLCIIGTCSVCLHEQPLMSCHCTEHPPACLPCWTNFIEQTLIVECGVTKDITPLRCLSFGHPERAPHPCTMPLAIALVLSPRVRDLQKRLAQRRRLMSNPLFPDTVDCPQAGCVGVGYRGHDTIMCFICEFQWEDKGGDTVPEVIATDTRKACPGCGILIEKTGGCNHMTCKCRHEFWWTTLKPYANGTLQ